jgi:hypothetical protein
MQHESISDLDLGWAIGLLEGEGCFGAYSDKRRPDTWTVKIQMESTDYDVVTRLNTLFLGRVWESNYPSKKKAFPLAKDSWRWSISDKQRVKTLCLLIYPHMSLRRKAQIDNVLTHCEYKSAKKRALNTFPFLDGVLSPSQPT